MTNDLTKTLADLTTWLRSEHVSFAVIGGLAVGVRGEPRFTADVDVVVGLDLDDALQLVDRLPGSPFQPLFSDVAEVVRTSFILPLRHLTSGVRVDVAMLAARSPPSASVSGPSPSFGSESASSPNAESELAVSNSANSRSSIPTVAIT